MKIPTILWLRLNNCYNNKLEFSHIAYTHSTTSTATTAIYIYVFFFYTYCYIHNSCTWVLIAKARVGIYFGCKKKKENKIEKMGVAVLYKVLLYSKCLLLCIWKKIFSFGFAFKWLERGVLTGAVFFFLFFLSFSVVDGSLMCLLLPIIFHWESIDNGFYSFCMELNCYIFTGSRWTYL